MTCSIYRPACASRRACGAYGDPLWEYHQWSVPYTKMRCVWIRLGMARCMVAVRKHSRPGSNSYAWPLRHAHLSPMRQCNCRGVYSVQLECTFMWRRGGYSDTKHILCSCQTQLSSIKRYDLSRNSETNAPHIGQYVSLGVLVGPMVTLCGNTINGRCLIQRYGVFGYV